MFSDSTRFTVYAGVNISDREVNWTDNYRFPDVAVFEAGNRAKNCGSHFCGGPDLAIEIVSHGDRSRQKLGFYAQVGVRELWIVDREPWKTEIYERDGAGWSLPCSLAPDDGRVARSIILNATVR